jgi:hypothetical protein
MTHKEIKELEDILNTIGIELVASGSFEKSTLFKWMEKKKRQWEAKAFKEGFKTEQKNIIIRLGLDRN